MLGSGCLKWVYNKSCEQLCNLVWTACWGSDMTIWQTIYHGCRKWECVGSQVMCWQIYYARCRWNSCRKLPFVVTNIYWKDNKITQWFLLYMRITAYLQVLFKENEKHGWRQVYTENAAGDDQFGFCFGHCARGKRW